MRLFTAITLNEEMKDYLMEISERLRLLTVKGSFTLRDNYHLTLNFIGETSRLEQAKEALRQAVVKTDGSGFLLRTEGFGRFKRREGDICFIHVEKTPALTRLQRELVGKLNTADFDVDDLAYKPHLTLSRRTVFADPLDEELFKDQILKKSMEVGRIGLMKSERIHGILTYTEVYGIDLE